MECAACIYDVLDDYNMSSGNIGIQSGRRGYRARGRGSGIGREPDKCHFTWRVIGTYQICSEHKSTIKYYNEQRIFIAQSDEEFITQFGYSSADFFF
jgi:hypothetical protein